MTTEGPDLARVADVLQDIGDRLRVLSAELRPTPPAAVAPTPPPIATPVHVAARPVPPPVPVPPPFPAWQPPAPPGPTLWDRLSSEGAGSRILAWVGGVVTLAGVVLLLVLAVQRGYLAPVPRVVFGAAFGLALAGVGMWLRRKPNARVGAHAALGTGVAVLYLDIVAATTLLDLVPAYAGLLAALLVAVGGVLLAGRWETQLLAVYVVACSAVSAPIVAGGFVPLLLGFLLVLQVATTPVQLSRRWGGLCLAAALPPAIAAMVVGVLDGTESWTVAYLCLLTGLVQVVVAIVNAVRTPADHVAVALLLIAPAPTLLSATELPRTAATLLAAAIGVPLLLVWTLHRLRLLAVPHRFGLAAGAAATVALFQATTAALTGEVETLALLGEALLLGLLAHRLRYPAALLASVLFGLTGLLSGLNGPVRFELLAQAPTENLELGTIVTLAATGLLLAVAAVVLWWVAHRLGRLAEHTVAAAVTAGVLALYGAAGAVLSIGLAISPDRTGFLLGHVLVTASWTVGALVLLVRGVRSVPPRVAGLALVGAALAKLVLFDLSSLDGLARVAAFLVAGLVLLAAGHRYARLVAGRVT